MSFADRKNNGLRPPVDQMPPWMKTLYNRWAGFIQRCYNPNNPNYSRYGGRGITVCDRWRDSFDNFMADMGPCPAGLTLDRIDSNGNYGPANCRWADSITQNNNRCDNIMVEIHGERMTFTNAWRKYAVPDLDKNVARCRIVYFGWNIEKALSVGGKAGYQHRRYRRKTQLQEASQ